MSTPLDRIARTLFFRSLRPLEGGYLELVCPDQTYAFGEPAAELHAMAVIHDECFFLKAVTGADIGIGESFMEGDWSSPDLVALIRLVVRNLRLVDSSHPLLNSARALFSRLRHRFRSNSLRASSRNIRHHYDLGNDFYKLFLDERMVYSSALFVRPDDSLEIAQLQKLDLICRKLDLQPGDEVLEIGCGWGAFALHAARHYGACVTGITLSPAQHEYASRLAEQTPLHQGSVRFLLEDYRKISGKFDKIVSIEMFEAVGLPRYRDFFAACDRLLRSDGAMLLQFISLQEQEFAAYRKRVDWIQTYIFPGSELGSLSQVERSLARSTQMSPVQMESFGRHYARTLAAWRAKFFQHLEAVERLGFGARFQRTWDFYLSWCEGAFLERYINVIQLLLSKNGTQRSLLGDPIVPRVVARRAAN